MRLDWYAGLTRVGYRERAVEWLVREVETVDTACRDEDSGNRPRERWIFEDPGAQQQGSIIWEKFVGGATYLESATNKQ